MGELVKGNDVEIRNAEADLSALLGKVEINVERSGETLIVLYDKSGSMSGEKWAELLKAATILEAHKKKARMHTVLFGDKLDLEDNVEKAYPDGNSTKTYMAVKYAVGELHKANSEVKRVILVTDGVQTDSSDEELVDFCVEAHNSIGVIFDTVGIGNSNSFDVLKDIAKGTNGKFYNVGLGNLSDLSTFLLELSPERRLLGYEEDAPSTINL